MTLANVDDVLNLMREGWKLSKSRRREVGAQLTRRPDEPTHRVDGRAFTRLYRLEAIVPDPRSLVGHGGVVYILKPADWGKGTQAATKGVTPCD